MHERMHTLQTETQKQSQTQRTNCTGVWTCSFSSRERMPIRRCFTGMSDAHCACSAVRVCVLCKCKCVRVHICMQNGACVSTSVRVRVQTNKKKYKHTSWGKLWGGETYFLERRP